MVAATNDVIQLLSDRTAIAAVRMHYSSLSSGATYNGTVNWIDLGALDPASPAFEFNKQITDVMTGSPMTIKQRHITQWDGNMSGEIIDYNDNAINAVIGTTTGLDYTLALTGQTTVAAGVSTDTQVIVTAGTGLAAGDRVRVELGNSLFTWYEVKIIQSVVADPTPATTSTVTLEYPLSEIPTSGADFQKVTQVKNIIGGNKLRDYQMRVIASFNDDSTMVIHAPKGNFTSPVTPNYGDGTTIAKIPVTFGIIGTSTTVPGFTGKQVVLANHYAFYPAST